MPIASNASNTELLKMYGSEPWDEDSTIKQRWYELTHPWSTANSQELGAIRQYMLRIDKELGV